MGMNSRKLVIFKHTGTSNDEEQRGEEGRMGRCPSWELFDGVKVKRKNNSVPSCYDDYEIVIDDAVSRMEGIELTVKE